MAGADPGAAVTLVAISAFGVFYLGVASIVVAGLVALMIWRRQDPPAVGSPPASWGDHPSDALWDQEAIEAQHKGLGEIRAAAKAWGETISALLGVFALVAFVKGPEAFTEVKGAEAEAAALLILLAAVLAAVAILLAALAAQGVPRFADLLDGWALRVITFTRAKTAARQLAWARFLAVAAALCVLGAVGLTWLAALDERDVEKPQRAVVVTGSGTICGEVSTLGGELRLAIGGQERRIEDPRQLTLVDSCP